MFPNSSISDFQERVTSHGGLALPRSQMSPKYHNNLKVFNMEGCDSELELKNSWISECIKANALLDPGKFIATEAPEPDSQYELLLFQLSNNYTLARAYLDAPYDPIVLEEYSKQKWTPSYDKILEAINVLENGESNKTIAVPLRNALNKSEEQCKQRLEFLKNHPSCNNIKM